MARAASPCNGPKEVVGMKSKQITNNQTRMRLPMMVKAFFVYISLHTIMKKFI